MFRKIVYSVPDAFVPTMQSILSRHGVEGVDKGVTENAAVDVASGVSDEESAGGILLGSWGLEGSVIGNKFPGVRASMITSVTTAMYTRCHNESNMLCIGTEIIGFGKCAEIIDRWLSSEFEGGRHSISVGMIRDGENYQFCEQTQNAPAMPSAYPFRSVWIANDHAGYEAKGKVLKCLGAHGIEVKDLGTHSTDIVRYPYYAARVTQAVLNGKTDCGILICGTGVGMSIASNKFKGARSALCGDVSTVRAARREFDANILCIGGKITGEFEIEEILDSWFETEYSNTKADYVAKVENENHMCSTDWAPINNI